MLRGLRLLQGVSWRKPHNQIQWSSYGNFLDLVVQVKNRRTICTIGEETNFNDLASMTFFKDFQFKYPKDFDPEIPVVQFLNVEDMALQVELRQGDELLFLNNIGKELSTPAILRGLSNKKGLLQMMNHKMDLGQTRNILTQAYLKLQAESFCRTNNYPTKSQLTPTIREEMLNYLCYKNETNVQRDIATLESNYENQLQTIAQYQATIKEIEANADRLLKLYQWGVIGITALHLVSFGYMIFFVDWLGWDIIEPVTFSVSCIYLLIALRFYRKFRRDRNEQTIRERFRELIMSPKKLMQLKTAHFKLKQQKETIKILEQKLVLSRNKLTPFTTLNASILQ